MSGMQPLQWLSLLGSTLIALTLCRIGWQHARMALTAKRAGVDWARFANDALAILVGALIVALSAVNTVLEIASAR